LGPHGRGTAKQRQRADGRTKFHAKSHESEFHACLSSLQS